MGTLSNIKQMHAHNNIRKKHTEPKLLLLLLLNTCCVFKYVGLI